MKKAQKRGLNFGITSGVITTLGLIYGLHSSVGTKVAILGGILTIAIADSLSDALGMHISVESTGEDHKNVDAATKYTFLSKFSVALTFLIPFLFLNIIPALILSTIWGVSIIVYVNYRIAKKLRKKPLKFITEHLSLTALVLILAHFVGVGINYFF